jgi:hypothetical protein
VVVVVGDPAGRYAVRVYTNGGPGLVPALHRVSKRRASCEQLPITRPVSWSL